MLHRAANCEVHWWTWAGIAANRTLHASLGGLVDDRQRLGGLALRMRADTDPQDISQALHQAGPTPLASPAVNDAALSGLKFSRALPSELARSTLANRLTDERHANEVMGEARTIVEEVTST